MRVLDLGEGVSGPFAARTLAWLGADVVKIEPPEGDYTRTVGPFPGSIPDQEKSALFLSMNAGKRGAVLDLQDSGSRDRLLRSVVDADVVVDNHHVGWMEERGVCFNNLADFSDGLIVCRILPFGDWGPYAGYEAGDLSTFHMSGNAHGMLGPVEDPNAEPPIRAGGHQADKVAGMAAATAILAALFRRQKTGLGCNLVVSSFEAMATQAIAGLSNIAFGNDPPTRDLAEVREASIGGQVSAIGGILPCNDGYVAISPREDAQWARWLEMMGDPDWGEDPKFSTRSARQENSVELWERLSEWTRERSRFDIAREGQSRRIPCFPVNTVADLLSDPHLREREFFLPIDHPTAGRFSYPGVPYKLSRSEAPIVDRPAPMLGQHNDEVLS